MLNTPEPWRTSVRGGSESHSEEEGGCGGGEERAAPVRPYWLAPPLWDGGRVSFFEDTGEKRLVGTEDFCVKEPLRNSDKCRLCFGVSESAKVTLSEPFRTCSKDESSAEISHSSALAVTPLAPNAGGTISNKPDPAVDQRSHD